MSVASIEYLCTVSCGCFETQFYTYIKAKQICNDIPLPIHAYDVIIPETRFSIQLGALRVSTTTHVAASQQVLPKLACMATIKDFQWKVS